ncbi:MAG: hypothetical protein NTU44_07775 [Bacteroidetes bacterium]|nr:hypothetical protein [Bacteroidota bacterium]
MKKLVVLLVFALVSMTVMSQSYLGRTTKEVKFHETAGDKTPVIKTLPESTAVCILSRTTEMDYYNIIEIATGEEGYIHKDFIKVGKKIRGGDKGTLKATGEISSVNPELDIINNTDKVLKLRLNTEVISILPKNHKTMTLNPGTFHYKAYAQGSIPITGRASLKKNQRYTWSFDFVTPFGSDELK